jgi:hypothetical protein
MEFPELDLTFEEEKNAGGVRVTQNGKPYLAHRWQLTDEVRSMIYLSISQYFHCLWVKNHPRGDAIHYICFARSHTPPWDYLLAKESSGERITVNKNHESKLRQAGIYFEIQTGGGHHLEIPPNLHNMDRVIDALK